MQCCAQSVFQEKVAVYLHLSLVLPLQYAGFNIDPIMVLTESLCSNAEQNLHYCSISEVWRHASLPICSVC